MGPDERLNRVTHIVVLMMENRSFDHMLGYLKLRGGRADVDGLTGSETNVGTDGATYGVRPMDDFAGSLADVLAVRPGPEHGRRDVLEQLGTLAEPDRTWTMDGFVRNYEGTRTHAPGVVMGYYHEVHVPVYDFLANEFTICDRWFCSMPNWTFPNRLFSLCGESEGVIGPTVPIFFKKSFFRKLDDAGVDWHSYYHDFAIPSLVDARYRLRGKHFFSFAKHFRAHCAAGTLPPVSWIDPNLVVVSSSGANDDHPPTSIAKGQALVHEVYEALRSSPSWSTTLLLIVYDEHGGFYDHVSPEASGDPSPFEWYGPRVPAFVVSPLAPRRAVCKTTFDHTSIIHTILQRFSPSSVPEMPARVGRAAHLGHALSAAPPRATSPAPALPALEVDMLVAGAFALREMPGPSLESVALFRDSSPALSDMQRATITAHCIIEAERERASTHELPALPEMTDLERQLIAADYLIERARSGE